MGLRVAVVGFDSKQSKRALLEIATHDVDAEIVDKTATTITMSDGTIYFTLPIPNDIVGYYIDQIIVVDDNRWNVFERQGDLLEWLQYRMKYSCVPDEFKIQKYEW